jgi:predicted acetyltransferase
MKIEKVNGSNKTLMDLLQAYEKEFSVITKKKPNDDGIFRLDVDVSKTDNFLLLDKVEAVGFCVKGVSDKRHDIFEFYVVPQNRGNLAGRKFAKEIFGMYKGDWQVRQINGANKAIEFWRKTISGFTKNNYEESVINDEYWGRVTRQTFRSL